MDKKIVFSGIQPSGTLTLGNYLGAVKNWQGMQDENNCIFSVVDLHAITVRQDREKFKAKNLEMMALVLACGIDPEKSLIFFQSHVPCHAELSWILNCYTMFGELSRMTQFKDKSLRHKDNINAGLFTYPALMAADILLYQTELVPVGEDQKQHLELARNIAIRFNGIYGNTFKVPEPYIPKVCAKVMSLTEPSKKMSKSDENINGFISLLDDTDTIIRKFKKAVTDSEGKIYFDKEKAGINNLLSIYSSISNKSIKQVEEEFSEKGYADFKLAVGELVDSELAPIRAKYRDLLNNKDYLKKIYTDSAATAELYASRTLKKVYKKIGFVVKES